MCGIFGFLNLEKEIEDPYIIKKMGDVVAHRGPDDAGYAFFCLGDRDKYALELTDNSFKKKNVHLAPIESDYAKAELNKGHWRMALGHRRLAIIDLTQRAHQPISNRSKTVWLTYSGEIYNFKEIRSELEKRGHVFYSDSDAEVVIHAYEEWGIDCVKRFNGMFAFFLFDMKKNMAYLARDRYGIKPMYFYHKDGVILFASEIKSIIQHPAYEMGINLEALNEYFTFQNLFRYHTLFKDVSLLPAANILAINFNTKNLTKSCFWDYNFSDRDSNLTEIDAQNEILRLFNRAVERQLVSDVPLGAYLSGGMDSGSVVAVAASKIKRFTTFTCGFQMVGVDGVESTYDERNAAELMADCFKTEHFEQVVNSNDLAWVMPKVIYHLEDLRVGMSYSNYYISRLASKFVKVCLNGGGGDELFGGYPWRYYRAFKSINREDFFRQYYNFWQRLVKDEEKSALFQPDVYRQVREDSIFEVFRRVFTFNKDLNYGTPEDHIANSMYFEIKTFLHGLFVVGDKLAMANSLEERVPFMDNELVDFAQKVPIKYKLKNLHDMKKIDENELKKLKKYYREYDAGKNILRKTMAKLIPQEILDRKKQGFSSPDESWYRGPNIEYLRQVLFDRNAIYRDYINPEYVQKILREHCEKKINHRLLIWSFLCFEWWLKIFIAKENISLSGTRS